MKKYFLIILLSFSFCKFSIAQMLCIYCSNHNSPISIGINNLLMNGGFENTTCIPNSTNSTYCPNSNNYSCNISNWTCSGGGSLTYACIVNDLNYTIIVEGTKAAYFGNNLANACSNTANDTSCLNMNCVLTGIPTGYPYNNSNFGGINGVSLEQTVNNLIIGNVYVLEFWSGGEGGTSNAFPYTSLFAVDIGFGKTFLECKATPPVLGIGKRYIIEFAATSSSHSIKFTNWGHICQGCTELILDDVRLYTEAELDASVPHCTVGIGPTPTLPGGEGVVPNPFSNELNIKTNNNELSEIIFYDIASRKLLQQTFFNSTTINTSHLSKGIYFYEIKNKEGTVKKGRVVKE